MRRSAHPASSARYRAFLERANAGRPYATTIAGRAAALRPYRVAAFRYLQRLASAIRRK